MKRFKNILYVADPLVPENSSLARAIQLSEANSANLTVVTIMPEIPAGIDLPAGGPISQDLQASLKKDYLQRLQDIVEACREQYSPENGSEGLAKITTRVLSGTVFLEIIRAVLRDGYDLVIKSAENPDWMERIFGSNDMHLLRKCPCPVWLHKPRENIQYKSIVAAVDLPEKESDQPELYETILTLACSIAGRESAQLHVVHAWQSMNIGLLSRWVDNPNSVTREFIDSERTRHENGLVKFRRFVDGIEEEKPPTNMAPRFHLLTGMPAEAIPEKASELNADLVVMGTVNRTGVSGLFIGNTAEAILEQLRCSIIAIKPESFETPVKIS